MSKPVPLLTKKEAVERYSGIIRGYMAFISAMLLILLANRVPWYFAWLPEVLFALSLPSLVALEALEYFHPVMESNTVAEARGVAAIFGFGPSLIGLCIIVGHARWYAGLLFGLLVAAWIIVLVVIVHEFDRNAQISDGPSSPP